MYFLRVYTYDAVKLRLRIFAFSEILCMFASEINNNCYLGHSEFRKNIQLTPESYQNGKGLITRFQLLERVKIFETSNHKEK